jgi:hypothetical protein
MCIQNFLQQMQLKLNKVAYNPDFPLTSFLEIAETATLLQSQWYCVKTLCCLKINMKGLANTQQALRIIFECKQSDPMSNARESRIFYCLSLRWGRGDSNNAKKYLYF